jgi:hypothetical protein
VTGELIEPEAAPAGPTLWCTCCSAKREAVPWPMGFGVTLYRCGSCGHWMKCPTCMAIRSAEHDCEVRSIEGE